MRFLAFKHFIYKPTLFKVKSCFMKESVCLKGWFIRLLPKVYIIHKKQTCIKSHMAHDLFVK